MARPAFSQSGTTARVSKRKHASRLDAGAAAAKRAKPDNSTNNTSLSLQPLSGFVADLQPKYEVRTLSVLSSTSIAKRVDAILKHLGRFHPWDPTVLPGVILLYARSAAVNKLITIAETVRRRIHEGDQKWYQYNRLYEMEWTVNQSSAATPQGNGKSVIEDLAIGAGGRKEAGRDEEDDDDDDGYFETMNSVGAQAESTPFERAILGEQKTRSTTHMSIFLSRVPVPELRAKDNFAIQSNEEHIDHLRKQRAGLA